MKRNNGFTLIELLATIIILVGVALVAFPILLNTIKNSENKIDGATRKLVESAAKLYVDNNLNDYPKKEGNTYCIPFSKLIEEKHLEKGILDAANVDSSNKVVKVTVTDDYGYEITNSGDCTVELAKICRPVTTEEVTTGNIPTGNYVYGDEYICDPGDGEYRHFFVLENNANSDSISLITDRNIGDPVAWCASGSTNPCNADGAKAYLETQTIDKRWTVDVSLPTGQQIATASGDTEWTDNNYSMKKLPLWLYGNMDSDSLRGYWTSTIYSRHYIYAWEVGNNGLLSFSEVDNDQVPYYGIRPVITISKDEL